MRRRVFIAGLAGSAATWPVAARAQQVGTPVVGLLGSATESGWAPHFAAFRRGLGEAGFSEGRNVTIEARWANNQYDRLPAMALELARRQVAVIVAFTTPSARAAKAATTNIPIVFTTVADPVQMGFVASLAQPGGNMTGVTLLNVEVGPKVLEILHEAVPTARIVALLVNPTNPNTETQSRNLQAAAGKLGLELHVVHARAERDFDAAFAKVRELHAGGLMVASDVLFNAQTSHLAALAVDHGVPAISQDAPFAASGGLMSYSGSIPDSYRQAGVYTGRILHGEKPAALPVVQTTKVELVVNLKAAKALGITVPLPLLGRADEVIE